jgi:predicted dehydrogenase
MVNKSDCVLVIGGGSIGERHISNLLAAGYSQVAVLRKRNLLFRNSALQSVRVVTTEMEALALNPKAAVICTPTSLHLSQSIWCLENDMHVLAEKPLSHTLDDWHLLENSVKSSGKLLYVGYMMRFHPLVKAIKEKIESEELGHLLSFTSHWGEYLPNWHPWEDYKTSYAAQAHLGGGASLTLSHDLDIVNYLVGKPLTKYFCLQNHASNLEVTAEAGADFLMEYENKTTGHVHVNYFEQPANRFLHLVFDKGRIEFYCFKNELKIITPNHEEVILAENFDRNQLFVSELEHFFSLANSTMPQSVSESMLQESETIIRMCMNKPLSK